ncbi:hypothetical protein [Erythrobacter sp. YT30]|uniref:hypothetical protein n=1 Tax=Erythrobacter sp. YT30 TaxID=1735012 RepID=UPI000A8E9CC4|nr:hypothetical protein [Erythrobacter sp. YT30]
MNFEAAREFVTKHKWWVAALLVVVAGYTFGKDMALRDNARDVDQISAGAQV